GEEGRCAERGWRGSEDRATKSVDRWFRGPVRRPQETADRSVSVQYSCSPCLVSCRPRAPMPVRANGAHLSIFLEIRCASGGLQMRRCKVRLTATSYGKRRTACSQPRMIPRLDSRDLKMMGNAEDRSQAPSSCNPRAANPQPARFRVEQGA